MAPPLSIKLRCASWQQLSAIYKRDLSRSAMFLRTTNPPAIGTAVRIDLTLPSESMIVLSGVVGEHIPPGGLEGRGPGVDVKLNALPQSAMWLIETALASAQKERADARANRARTAAGAEAPAEAGLEDGNDWAQAEDELLAALTSEYESLRKLNPFQVLGVGYEATDADVRAAFAELTKRYHPDRFARYPSQELRRHAAEIFILIRDAYRRLGDERGRQQAAAQAAPKSPPTAALPPLPPLPPPAVSSTAPPPPSAVLPPLPPPRPVTPAPVRAPTAPTSAKTPPPVIATAATRPLPTSPGPDDGRLDHSAAEGLLEQGRYEEALAVFKIYARRHPSDRLARAGIELAEGLKALAQRDRLEAAQRFEAVLELDPSNERAARELADMRRQATNERKGLLTRLLGKKE